MMEIPEPPLAGADRSLQLARLRQFLRYMIPVAAGLAALYLVAGLLLDHLALKAAAVDVLAYVAALLWARRATGQGRVEAAAQAIAYSLLTITAIAVPLLLFALPALVIIPLAAVALVIPYLQGRELAFLLIFAMGVEVVAMGVHTLGLAVGPPTPRGVQLAATWVGVVAASGLALLLLWQDARRLSLSLTVGGRNEARSRRLAERLRQITLASAQIIWTTDPSGAVTEDSPTWRAFTGQSEEELRGSGWLLAIHPEDRPAVEEAWREAIRAQAPFRVEYRLRRAGGGWAHTVARAVPVREPDGSVREWVGTNEDVTAQREAEAERDRLLAAEQEARQRAEIERQRAEEASRLKDEFLSTVSHELRTPLAAILGWAQLLAGGRLAPDKRARAVETIERNARAQAQLVEDLLDVSRILSGKMLLNVEDLRLAPVVEAAADAVRPAADARGVRLRLELDPDAQVAGDGARLQQVAWNLLSNAVKFTPAGGLVSASLRAGGGAVELAVADTGQGIPPEFLPHVFERFRQASSDAARAHGGLGLGLAIVRHLVELHGGSVRAASEGPGRGSCFTVRFPESVARAEAPREPAEADPGPACPPELRGLRVLVVDDERDLRDLLRLVLADCGVEVSAAASAAEALTLLQGERPDVLVSDIGMPGEDGYSLLRRVRELPPEEGGQTPAIALTAYTRAEDRARALGSGFDAHVAKPVEPAALLAALAALCQRASG